MKRYTRDAFLARNVACALLVAGCGGSGPSATGGGSPDTGQTTGSTTDGGTGGSSSPGTTLAWPVPDSATALDAAALTAFSAGNLYYNAHTAAHPGGEIRGQLDKGGTLRVATLDGSQETPPVTTTSFGAGAFAVDDATGQISGFLVTSGLISATAAHVHLGARGAPGAVIVPLTGGPELWVVPDGAAPLTTDQVTAFKAGNLYVNAHTAANPGGEIRGQLDKTGTARFASLDGPQETPPTSSTARGGAVLVVDGATGKAGGFIVTSGLVSPNAAHVHTGARGTPGPVILPLTGGPNLWVVPDAASALPADQLAAFSAQNLYYNVHTAANPGGDIRGQLAHGGTVKVASLDGTQETPPVPASTAFGAGLLAVDDGSGDLGGFLVTSGLVSPTAAHVHSGARGIAGPVLVPLAGP
jgi:hypothetical protein